GTFCSSSSLFESATPPPIRLRKSPPIAQV
ncbi:hypothetical protein D039_0178B, partial [Vibrio parahaemolyticus EKP-028]